MTLRPPCADRSAAECDALSVVLPVQNAEGTLAEQVARLLEIVPDLSDRFEILLVDDGSTDHTLELAQELARRYPQLRVLRHDRAGGRQAALDAGRRAARSQRVMAADELEGAAGFRTHQAHPPRPSPRPGLSFRDHLRRLVRER
jgi:glycosyltransferase involved in cell wall biosynthesis